MNTIPQHDLVANIRKKLRDDKNRKMRKIINNGTFRLSEIFSKVVANIKQIVILEYLMNF